MHASLPVIIPLLNPNEPEAQLVAVHVQEGQKVLQDDLICTLETTKSTAEVKAEKAGYIIALRYQEGSIVRAGDTLCYLADTPAWEPPPIQPEESDTPEPLLENLRISQPALELARQHNLDLSQLPGDTLITTRMVQALITPATTAEGPLPKTDFDPTSIIVYGGGGHGKALIDLIRALGTYSIAGVLDDGIEPETVIMGIPVLGGNQVLADLYTRGTRMAVNAVGGIGNLQPRLQVFKQLSAHGFVCPALVHPRALVEPSANLSAGVQVFAHAYVGSEAQVGFGSIINTGAIVSHDCILAEHVNISPGAILAGEVHIGAGALVGMGVTINLRVNVGAGARLGNGSTIKSDVPENGIVRAGTIWPE